MDLTIPRGMGGREALGHLLDIDEYTCAIVSSGYSDDPVMADYANHGFADVVAKPYDIVELSHVLSPYAYITPKLLRTGTDRRSVSRSVRRGISFNRAEIGVLQIVLKCGTISRQVEHVGEGPHIALKKLRGRLLFLRRGA